MALGTFALLARSSSAQSVSLAESPSAEVIAQRMAQSQLEARARRQAYTATRIYRVYGGNEQQPKSEVDANINFLPPTSKSYVIERSSGGMAEHVVRKALDKEVELSKTPELTELSPNNYNFQKVGEEQFQGQRCYVLTMTPKQDDKDLIKGKVWIDANTYLVRHVEGSPSKSPSWWVHDVQISFTFNEVQGMWLQTSSEALAKIRFAGDYILRSEDTNFRTSETMADATTSPSGRDFSNADAHRRSIALRRAAKPQP